MWRRSLLKDENGAVLPFVVIILGLFALGFIALAIDAGILYAERKAMVTASDAAALAGAQVLRESNGANTVDANKVVLEYALANGAETIEAPNGTVAKLGTLEADALDFVVNKEVTLPDGKKETRSVVDVTVGKREEAVFSRFLGNDSTDVKANAVSTWGYVKKAYIGDFLPIFVFDENYKLDSDIYLHEKIDGTNGYGYVDIGGGMGAIKEAIAGKDVGGSYIYDNLLDGKPGNGASLLGAVEERMKMAQGKSTAVERRNAMIGLVPIIDKEEFSNIPGNSGSYSHWKLPIKYFAYYEILDVIKQNNIVGSVEALNPDNEYKRRGTGINYKDKLPADLLKSNKVEYVTIIGRFTGEIVDVRTIAEIGDQVNPNPGGDPPATYSKLIK